MKAYILAACAVLLATPVYAQVGVSPEKSPFRDIENRMEISLLSGIFSAGKEPVGVGPQSGPYVGARYELGFGSLVSLAGRLGVVSSSRTVINPSLPAATRVLGEIDDQLVLVDAGLAFNLTGGRSFHKLVPTVSLGIGMITDLKKADAGGYSLGKKFLFTLGGGVKWMATPAWQLRADVVDNIFAIDYPASYFDLTTDGTSARSGDESIHTHNVALTLGLSYRFFR